MEYNIVAWMKDGDTVYENDVMAPKDVKIHFDRPIIVINLDLLNAGLGIKHSDFDRVLTKFVEVDPLEYMEYQVDLITKTSANTFETKEGGLISSCGSNLLICYADEAAKWFGYETPQALIDYIRKCEDAPYGGEDKFIQKEFDASNISDVIKFNGNLTIQQVPFPEERAEGMFAYEDEVHGVLVIKCEPDDSSKDTFFITTADFLEDETEYFLQ